MNIEFEEDVYKSRQIIGSPEQPGIAKFYQKLGISEKNIKKAILITPFVCFGLSIALLLWYFL